MELVVGLVWFRACLQQLVHVAEHGIGQDQMLAFLQPCPVFCNCRLHLSYLDFSVRLEPRDDCIDPIPHPVEFLSLSGQPKVFPARPPLAPTAFAACCPSTRSRYRSSTLTPRRDGAVGVLVRCQQSYRAAAAADAELSRFGSRDNTGVTGTKGTGLDYGSDPGGSVSFIYIRHALTTLFDAGIERPNCCQLRLCIELASNGALLGPQESFAGSLEKMTARWRPAQKTSVMAAPPCEKLRKFNAIAGRIEVHWSAEVLPLRCTVPTIKKGRGWRVCCKIASLRICRNKRACS